MSQGIPKNQVKTRATIEQAEHEDGADARRITPVDKNGDFHDATNPAPTLEHFVRNGAPQVVTEDTVDPTNNRPLPVKLTGVQGDVVIEAENLNLQVQLEGEYDAIENPKPDSTGIVAHERGATQNRTNQNRRPTAKRGSTDTDTVSIDVALHNHEGNKYDEENPFPVVKVPLDSVVAPIRHDYASVTVTTGAYVQLVASIGARVRRLCITDTSGRALYLAFGAAASEVDQIIIPNGAADQIDLEIPAGTRLSIKTIDANATKGHLLLSFLE